MKLELKPFDFAQAVARAGLRPDGHPVGSAVAGPAPAGFGAAMTQALRAVSDSQLEASGMVFEQFETVRVLDVLGRTTGRVNMVLADDCR